jgi:hypothetical protein
VAGTINGIRELSGSRNARAVSACSGSTDLAPSIVFSRIGQVVPNAGGDLRLGAEAEGNGEHRHKATVRGPAEVQERLGRPTPLPTPERVPSGTPTAAVVSPPQTRPRLGRMLLVAPHVSNR